MTRIIHEKMRSFAYVVKFSIIMLLAISSFGYVSEASANDNGYEFKLRELEQQIKVLRAEQDKMKKEQEEQNKSIKSNSSNSFSNFSKLKNLRFYGRLHVDGRWYDENKLSNINDSKNDDFDIKRARFGIFGQLGEDLDFYFETNVNEEASRINEAWVKYKGLPFTNVKVGQMTSQVSMEFYKSTNTMALIDYSKTARVKSAFTQGVELINNSDNWFYAVQVGGGSDGSSKTQADDSETQYNARVGYVPVLRDDSYIYVGTGFAHRRQNKDNFTIAQDNIFNLETALTYKNFNIQSEYINNFGIELNSDRDTDFDRTGYYVQLSYFLTGEHRKYNAHCATIGGIKVTNPVEKGGIGAWEIAARYSELDARSADVRFNEGKSYDYTVGANWYLNDYARIMFNYSKNYTDYDYKGLTPADFGKADNDQYDLYVVRFQVNF